jgi:hypothetical protein
MSRTRKIRRDLVYCGVLAVAGAAGGVRIGSHLVRDGGDAALIAMMLHSGAPPSQLARNMAMVQGAFVALFTASSLLFRHASLAELK